MSELDSPSAREADSRPANSVPGIRLRESFANLQKTVVDAQQSVIDKFNECGSALTPEEKAAAIESTYQLQKLVAPYQNKLKSLRIPELIAQMDEKIRAFPEKDQGREFGHQFLIRRMKSKSDIVIDPALGDTIAVYRAFDADGRFINQIAVNPEVNDVYSLANALTHEYPHLFQMESAEALWHNPNNFETNVVVHPIHWIKLEGSVCERDAFYHQARFNYHFSQDNPDVRKASAQRDLVTVDDFLKAQNICSNPAETAVEVAIAALTRIKKSEFGEYSFANAYHWTALNNFNAGMFNRRQKGIGNDVFVRLEDDDLYQVGNYGVGPNSLGKYRLDPFFARDPELFPYHKKRLEEIMRTYNIPPLENCPTLAEYKQQLAAQKEYGNAARMPAPAANGGGFVPAFA